MPLETSTLRPGLLVSVKTSVRGNVGYQKTPTETRVADGGVEIAEWETTRTITDPVEHEAAGKARSKARSAIRGVCAESAFGLLCPEAASDNLERAIADARRIIETFNAGAKLSRVTLFVIAGRVASDDVEAVRAINSEVRDLLETMEAGVANADPKVIRDAASRAKSLAVMLSVDAAARVQVGIDAARSAARKIVQAGEQAAQEVDRQAIALITEARTAFLDLGPAGDVGAPVADARAVDLAPVDVVAPAAAPATPCLDF